MLFYLILLFTIVPAVELILIIEVGQVIGSMNTLMLIILTGILGATLARLQGLIVLQKFQNNINQGQMPNAALMDGFLILMGGFVLLTPGFITDTIGFLLLIPWTRSLIKIWLQRKVDEMIRKGQAVQITKFGRQDDDYQDIDITK